MLIDTHCHLNFKVFKGKVREIIDRAKKAGVERIIVPGSDLKTSIQAVELAQKYEGIYAAVGIHPHHCLEIKDVEKARQKLKHLGGSAPGRIVGIGECGLDYHQYQKTKYKNYKIDKDFKKNQKEIFKIEIELAKKLALPLIIHNRQASRDILETLNTKYSILNTGVFHCFEGDENLLRWGLKHNFYFGITGNVTYNQKVAEVVKNIPLKNLLIETDSPFLTPEPLRQTKKWPNEPKNVKIVARRIAEIKGDSFLNVVKTTKENTIKLFNI